MEDLNSILESFAALAKMDENDITDDDMSYLKENGCCRWLRILACGSDDSVINDLNNNASVPVLFRDSDVRRYLPERDAELMKKLKKNLQNNPLVSVQ